MYSPYAKQLLAKLSRTPPLETKKLVPNLMDKANYVTHYRNLQFYTKMGMKITKVHRILTFKQSPWLARYIQLNTDKRKSAKSTFEKDLYKLMNNSVFGKTIENLRNRIDVKLVADTKKAERLCALPTFNSFNIINDDITMVRSNPSKIFWNKPTYVGFCVLELSKLTMYEFHYNNILALYGKNAKLLFSDTDSLCYEIITDDLYADMAKNLDWFDTSDYPPNHTCYSTKNAKVIGKFKDEMNGNIVQEFVGLRAKMYSLLDSNHEKLTAKGIKKSFVAKHLRHQMYKDCLFGESSTRAEFHTLRSRNHQVRTELVEKDALSCFDDKRFLLENTTDTYAYGNYKIKSM
jgi:hypothetical protein